MLKMIHGCKFAGADQLEERYEKNEGYYLANIDEDKIKDIFIHFISMQTQEMYMFLEVPSSVEVEEELRKKDSDPMHLDVYFVDELDEEEVMFLLQVYGDIFIQDGLTSVGFGVQDFSIEIMLDKYNIVTLRGKELDLYNDFFEQHDISCVKKCKTAWDYLSKDLPGECNIISVNGKDVFDAIEELEEFGLYFAERREDR